MQKCPFSYFFLTIIIKKKKKKNKNKKEKKKKTYLILNYSQTCLRTTVLKLINNAELDEIRNYIGDNVNKNTEKKTKSDLSVWQRWISHDQNIHETRKMEDIPPERLDILLSLLFMRFRK